MYQTESQCGKTRSNIYLIFSQIFTFRWGKFFFISSNLSISAISKSVKAMVLFSIYAGPVKRRWVQRVGSMFFAENVPLPRRGAEVSQKQAT